ncbi:MAG: methylase [Clostridiaceae bacterium]|jgi:hypothetical protein|nr:methylase [Clostridiaceae bacterium]
MLSEYDVKRLLKFYLEFKNKILLNVENNNIKFEDINDLMINSYLKFMLCYYIGKLNKISNEYIISLIYSDEFFNLSFFELISMFYGFKQYNLDEKIKDKFKLIRINYSIAMKENCAATYNVIKNLLDHYNSMDISILGLIYERIISVSCRKNMGVFYTNSDIINNILKFTIDKVNIVDNPNIKVLDPSCGSGLFLIKAYELLYFKFRSSLNELNNKFSNGKYHIFMDSKKHMISGRNYWIESNLHYHIINNCIYGADKDYFAVAITIITLFFMNPKENSLTFNIEYCDSLVQWENKCGNKSMWSKKFDIILGNPPWVSLSRKNKIDISSNIKTYYQETYKISNFIPNLYIYFIKRALDLIDVNGIMCFLVPDRLCYNKYLKEFRLYLLQNFTIDKIIINGKFSNVIAESIILSIRNSVPNLSYKTSFEINKKELKFNQSIFLKNLNYEFNYPDDLSEKLKMKIEQNSTHLSDIFYSYTGFIGYKSLITKSQLGIEYIKILKGRCISNFTINSHYYYPYLKNNLKGGTTNTSKLNSPKLLVKKTGAFLTAAYDKNGTFIEQSLYGLILKDRSYPINYILAILNSDLMNWYYRRFLITNLNSTPQLKKYNLDIIPIKKCSDRHMKIICDVVNKISCQTNLNSKPDKFLLNTLNNAIYSIYELTDLEINEVSNDIKK